MKKVLYIDDEADREKMESKFDVLRDEGVEVIRVTRVGDALGVLDQFKSQIGLIVIDLLMPPEGYYSTEETNGGTKTGLRLLRDIRAKWADIPVIIVSIRHLAMNDPEVLKLHVKAILQKPIAAAELAENIKKAIQPG